MHPRRVSVMMPAYNAEEYVGEAIDSVLAQSYPHWELIVVDDGSIDGTVDVVDSIDDPRIKLIWQANEGESAARNTALKYMQGDLVAFLDADDLFMQDHLAQTVKFLKNNPQYDAVYTDGYYCDSSGNLLKTLSSRRRGPFNGDVFAEVVRGSDLFGPPVCVVLDRSRIVEHNLQFDEAITIGPDWVFLMQYAAMGQFGYLDQYTCLYRIHKTNISFRVDLQRRVRELAKCRIRSIHLDGFDECPVDVRAFVFYDLLVNLLRDMHDEQEAITQWPQFQSLPTIEQARLLRLMASQSMFSDYVKKDDIRNWLKRSSELDPSDIRSRVLLNLYTFHPQLTRRLLEIKRRGEIDPLAVAPFADIDMSANHIKREVA